MKFLLTLAVTALALGGSVLGASKEYETDLNTALDAAHAQNKMMFIIFGRAVCPHCQKTRAMIKSRQINLSESKYVLVDLNIDDPQVSEEYYKRYGKENLGNTLPYVIVADFAGNALASSGGPKDANEWEHILKAAQKKAGTVPATTDGAAKPDWPFKKGAPATPGR